MKTKSAKKIKILFMPFSKLCPKMKKLNMK